MSKDICLLCSRPLIGDEKGICGDCANTSSARYDEAFDEGYRKGEISAETHLQGVMRDAGDYLYRTETKLRELQKSAEDIVEQIKGYRETFRKDLDRA